MANILQIRSTTRHIYVGKTFRVCSEMLTDLELSKSPFPAIPDRLTLRGSKTLTTPTYPKSYEGIRPWQRFKDDAAALAASLDNQVRRNVDPMEFIEPLDEEVGVRVPLEAHIFPQTNKLAHRLGLVFKYKQGGSGRSFSCTDLLILDTSVRQELKQLSARVYGNGTVRGNWQCTLAGFPTLDAALADVKNGEGMKAVIQQLFGDMVLDETKYGFITEYNYTVFFRRVAGTKILEFSSIVKVGDAPLEKFLFVLQSAEVDKNSKHNISRLSVKDTPPGGYQILLGFQSNRLKVYYEDNLDKVPTYGMDDLGITGAVIGMGKYGNVVEGRAADGTKLALKCFDLRKEQAASALVREQEAYERLRTLQGTHIPRLLAVGRIPHTSIVFLVLTDEGEGVERLLQGKQGSHVERCILQVLSEIHSYRVLHNDIKLSHVLWNHGPKIIDFDSSTVAATREDLLTELTFLEEKLAEVRNHEL